MRMLARTTLFALAMFGLVFAGVALDQTTVSVARCETSNCSVGGYGIGGVSSDERAQGGHARFEDSIGLNTRSGNQVEGTGRYTGPEAPPCTGQCGS